MVSAGRKASDYMSHQGELLSSFGPYLIQAAGRGLLDAAKDLLFVANPFARDCDKSSHAVLMARAELLRHSLSVAPRRT